MLVYRMCKLGGGGVRILMVLSTWQGVCYSTKTAELSLSSSQQEFTNFDLCVCVALNYLNKKLVDRSIDGFACA